MYRIFYVSTAAPGLDEDAIASLVEQARNRNGSIEITGALRFNGVNFGQVLEGPEPALNTLMGSIRRDSRHSGLIVVAERPVSSRAYADFVFSSMEGLDFQDFLDAMSH